MDMVDGLTHIGMFLKDEYSRSVTFRLYSGDGYPVFNDRGISEIKEIWGRDEIIKYVAP